MSLGNRMKRETIHEGWLTKSPPRKKFEKIWKLRWRRRWFALRQGELPGQFFLQYYTDSNCRKLKGEIDLEQCEQVDAGLRMQYKYQHMFDIKTPQRIYYLAADSEEDMIVWVKWICQVCGLQETTRIRPDVQYFNIGPDAMNEAPLNSNTSLISTTSTDTNTSTVTNTTLLNNNHQDVSGRLNDMSIYNTYQNTLGDVSFRGSDYTNRETILISEAHKLNSINNNNSINVPYNRSIAETYTNFSTIERAIIERSHSLKSKALNSAGNMHSRTQSLDEHGGSGTAKYNRKLLETLKLTTASTGDKKPSPALSSSSGAYIPISECFSGGAFKLDKTVGQTGSQYSPKSQAQNASDSESVFTDDEWSHPVMPQNTLNRNKRQSETSLDNDNLTWSYVTRFSKVSNDDKAAQQLSSNGVPPPRPPKRISGIFAASSVESSSGNKESPLPSPSFIGPRDARSVVDESYDIPRSHRIGSSRQNSLSVFDDGLSPIDMKNAIASSTPNLINNDTAIFATNNTTTLPHVKHNFYTNAAPTKKIVDGNIFRYDFFEQGGAPAVNRKLKPGTKQKAISESSAVSLPGFGKGQELGPAVDRTLKPATPKTGHNSNRRIKGPSASMNITLPDEHTLNSLHDDSLLLPKTPKFPEDRLQYLDLDHSSTPSSSKKSTPNKAANTTYGSSVGNLFGPARGTGGEILPTVAYTTVDFVKTDAFNRIREETTKHRMKK